MSTAPAPPPKPGPLREAGRDFQQSLQNEPTPGSQVQTPNGEIRDRTLSAESLSTTVPEDNGLTPNRPHDSSVPNGTRTNGIRPGSPQHTRRLTSQRSATDIHFPPPRRAHTEGSAGIGDSQRPTPGGTTPRRLTARPASGHLLLSASGSKIRPGDTDLQDHEEKFCVFAQQLIDMLRRKPQREQTKSQHKLTFKEAISHFMKVNRVRVMNLWRDVLTSAPDTGVRREDPAS